MLMRREFKSLSGDAISAAFSASIGALYKNNLYDVGFNRKTSSDNIK